MGSVHSLALSGHREVEQLLFMVKPNSNLHALRLREIASYLRLSFLNLNSANSTATLLHQQNELCRNARKCMPVLPSGEFAAIYTDGRDPSDDLKDIY